MSDFKETDLYEPVKKLFEGMGFSVYSEVKDCDLMAVKEEKTIIAELKKSFNITLVYQLLDRQSFCKNVYAVIPRPKKGARDRNFKSMVKLCKRLDLGLITVAVESPMKITEIICSPEEVNKITNYAKKKKVLTGDLKPGFALDLVVKDLELARQLCQDMKVPNFTLNTGLQFYREAQRKGHGKDDSCSVIRVIREQ